MKVPEPPRLEGNRDPKALDNFLWSVERYFEDMHVEDDASKICTATMYLSDNAILCWRRGTRGHQEGTMLDCNVGRVEEELEECVLVTHSRDPQNGGKGSSHLFFMDGLQTWAELRRRGVKTLAEGIAVAESLVEVSSGSRHDKGKVDEESDHEGEEALLQSRAKHIAYGKDKAQSKGDSRNEEGKRRNEGRQRQVHAGAWESVKCLISLGKWKVKVDFLVVDMEDEDVVLGWEFLNSVTPVTMGQEVMTITHNGCKHEIKLARDEEDGARNTSLKAWWVLGDKH
uniref:Uncharacterized protein n=1 Tax=Chenopodium quinoa TaxID=63459 RepID=A0A803N9L9_CHEQI